MPPSWIGYEVGLEKKKLECGAAELDWKRRSAVDVRLWVRRCLVLLLWVWFSRRQTVLVVGLEERNLERQT